MNDRVAGAQKDTSSDFSSRSAPSGKDLAIKELINNYEEALSRADLCRERAAIQPGTELATVFERQAEFETDKALGYLRHAGALRRVGVEEHDQENR